jgi:hypothetical protein
MQNNQNDRPHPFVVASRPHRNAHQIDIPPYAFEITPPENHESPWDNGSSSTPVGHSHSTLDLPSRPRNRTASVFEPRSGQMAPVSEADLYRSTSYESNLYGAPRHRPSQSDLGPLMGRLHRDVSTTSFASEYYDQDYFPSEVRKVASQ